MDKKLQILKNNLNGKWLQIENAQLILLSGLPGSGKSFWGKLLAEEFNSFYISSDKVRREILAKHSHRYIKDKKTYQNLSKIWYQELINRTKVKLANGESAVIDSTLLIEANRRKIISQLKNKAAKILILFFKCSNENTYKRLQGKGFDRAKNKDYGKACLEIRKEFFQLIKEGKASFPNPKNGLKVIEIDNNQELK